MTAEHFTAQVVAAFGRHLRVRDTAGLEWDARPFGRKLGLVCGDRTLCRRDPAAGESAGGEIHAVEVLPRDSALYRSNLRGGAELIVANLDLMLITVAPLPVADLFVVDRYLAAAASAGIAAAVVVNKSELRTAGHDDTLQPAALAYYEQLGHAVLHVSAKQRIGIEQLIRTFAGHTGVLVGQSGVGKSSLMRVLALDASQEIVTGPLVRDEEGSHTTTAARMYDCHGGGRLIDSPGVRDFAPALEHLEAATLGFTDVAALAPGCRFMDCRHMIEPGCAVRAATENSTLPARRYESYRRLRRLVEELRARRGPQGARPTTPRRGR